MPITGFISAEHERSMMQHYPKLWKEWVKKFGHHKDFEFKSSIRNRRSVGGIKKSPRRRVLRYGRKKRIYG